MKFKDLNQKLEKMQRVIGHFHTVTAKYDPEYKRLEEIFANSLSQYLQQWEENPEGLLEEELSEDVINAFENLEDRFKQVYSGQSVYFPS